MPCKRSLLLTSLADSTASRFPGLLPCLGSASSGSACLENHPRKGLQTLPISICTVSSTSCVRDLYSSPFFAQ